VASITEISPLNNKVSRQKRCLMENKQPDGKPENNAFIIIMVAIKMMTGNGKLLIT